MARIARVVAPGYPHHITHSGNYKSKIFLNNNDRRSYLKLIEKYGKQHEMKLYAYCLMNTHVHFIVIPEKYETLANTFSVTQMIYSQYFNKKMGLAGQLWHGRFFSCIMDELHLLAAARYIERNPVRAKLVEEPWDWEWSSAAFHCKQKSKSDIVMSDLFQLIDMNPEEWKEYISRKDDPSFIKSIQRSTLSGKPLANISTIKKLEQQLGRCLQSNPRGRQKK